MSENKINKFELDLLSTAIDKIMSSEIIEYSTTDKLPLTNDIPDANKIYTGKVTMLFADMRESTKLPDKFTPNQLVKIYRSYIRTVVQSIRYSGGVVRDFMGDGILAVFIDNEEGKSEDKSVRAARYIATAIDKFLNPVLDQKFKHRISCGIGIHTGNISISKVGMRGKEQQDNAENEFGIAWIGNSTNLACKFSSVVDNGTIFISASTYASLSDIDGKQKWEKIEISKGGNVLSGYIAKRYYLSLEHEIEPCPAGNSARTLRLVDQLKEEYQKQLANIAREAMKLGKKEQSLQAKEHQLNCEAAEIERKKEEIIFREQTAYKQEYQFHCDVLRSGHCQSTYVKEMGKDFWEDHLTNVLSAGIKIGKNEHTVKQEISYAMVSIYETLGLYDKAYDFLVEQATGCPWLLLSTVQTIVKKVGYYDRLSTAIYIRLAADDLSPECRLEFEKIRNWLFLEHSR